MEPKRIYVIPETGAEGTALRVRDPDHARLAPIPAEGKWVRRSTFWLRRLAKREVREGDPPKPAATRRAAAKTTTVAED